tara:strand:+ start:5126 stop:5512 length:387 start_codon:yes stop_codon:yes gene_type:complete
MYAILPIISPEPLPTPDDVPVIFSIFVLLSVSPVSSPTVQYTNPEAPVVLRETEYLTTVELTLINSTYTLRELVPVVTAIPVESQIAVPARYTFNCTISVPTVTKLPPYSPTTLSPLTLKVFVAKVFV